MMILEKLMYDRAVLIEDGEEITVPAEAVEGFDEGDVLICRDGVFYKDAAADEKRKSDIIRLQNSLWE